MTPKPKFDRPTPSREKKMTAIENSVEALPVSSGSPEPVSDKKKLPEELVSGDTQSQQSFTVRLEKDLKERLSFLVIVLKKSGDKNISVATTVERILRESVNKELRELGYDA